MREAVRSMAWLSNPRNVDRCSAGHGGKALKDLIYRSSMVISAVELSLSLSCGMRAMMSHEVKERLRRNFSASVGLPET